MLAIKHKIMLWKLNHYTEKRNEAYCKGDFGQATYYGELVNYYIDALHLDTEVI